MVSEPLQFIFGKVRIRLLIRPHKESIASKRSIRLNNTDHSHIYSPKVHWVQRIDTEVHRNEIMESNNWFMPYIQR